MTFVLVAFANLELAFSSRAQRSTSRTVMSSTAYVPKYWDFEAPPAGFEPATCGLEVRCSIQLSYGGSRDPRRARDTGSAGRARGGARPSLCAGLAVGSAGRHGSLHPAALRN